MVYVVNTYGHGSFGDDSCTETLQQHLAEAWPAAKIVVRRMEKAPFSPDHSQAVVLGGGGILYRRTQGDVDILSHFLRFPAAAQLFGKKTFALSLGVQGGLKPEHLEPYVDIFNAMTLTSVRDLRSAEILREAGTASVMESADLSYAVKIPARSQREARKKPVLGVAASQPDKGVIYDESHGFEDRVLQALHELQQDFDIRFYSFDRRTDGAIPSAWTGPHSTSFYDPTSPGAVSRFVEEIADSDLFLTSRLHGVIFCARMGIPFVSIGAPEEKVERESQALEQSFHLAYSANAGEIASAIRAAWADRDRNASSLNSSAARREAMALGTLEALQPCN